MLSLVALLSSKCFRACSRGPWGKVKCWEPLRAAGVVRVVVLSDAVLLLEPVNYKVTGNETKLPFFLPLREIDT